MSPQTDTRTAPSAVVLTHPTFDRPAVENPPLRGRPAGCVSLRVEQRKRRAAARVSEIPQPAERRATPRDYMRLMEDGQIRITLWKDDPQRAMLLLTACVRMQAMLLNQMDQEGWFPKSEPPAPPPYDATSFKW